MNINRKSLFYSLKGTFDWYMCKVNEMRYSAMLRVFGGVLIEEFAYWLRTHPIWYSYDGEKSLIVRLLKIKGIIPAGRYWLRMCGYISAICRKSQNCGEYSRSIWIVTNHKI